MGKKIIWISNFSYDFYDLFFNIADNFILNWYKIVFLFPNQSLKTILKNRKYYFIENKDIFLENSKRIHKILFWESSSKDSKFLINFSKKNNIKTFFFENWYFPNTFQIDHEWQNQKSSIYDLKYEELIKYSKNIKKEISDIKIKKFQLQLIEKIKLTLNIKNTFKSIFYYLNSIRLKNYRNKILNKEKNNKLKNWNYIFIPFQVHDDSQIKLYSDIIKKMDDILNYFYNDIKKTLPNHKIVVKEHPMDLWRINYSKLREKYEDIIWFKWWNLDDIISKSEYIIVVNSSVWLQCLEKHKKVLLLWNAIYEKNIFVEKINKKSEFKNKLQKLKNKKLNKKDIDKYINKFKNEIFFSWGYNKFNNIELSNILNFIIDEK